MKLLVPVDGSASSINAAKKSAELAKKYNFSIKLIFVVSSGTSRTHRRNEQFWRQVDGSSITGRVMDAEDEELSKEMRSRLDDMMDSLIGEMDSGTVRVEKEILFGEPYEKIIETSETENFDLIVMGSQRTADLKHFFTSSVTQKVVSGARCPVLVFHTEEE